MKPGWKTSEFYVTTLTIIGLVVASISAPLSPKYAAIGASMSGAAYAISRGLAKLFPPKGGQNVPMVHGSSDSDEVLKARVMSTSPPPGS